MLAQVIQRKGTVYDLTELEQAYAPPYSSAKDPVNMAGYVAENILTQKVETINWRDIAQLGSNSLLVDVRTADEYNLGSYRELSISRSTNCATACRNCQPTDQS